MRNCCKDIRRYMEYPSISQTSRKTEVIAREIVNDFEAMSLQVFYYHYQPQYYNRAKALEAHSKLAGNYHSNTLNDTARGWFRQVTDYRTSCQLSVIITCLKCR
jgi:hypothetical protein